MPCHAKVFETWRNMVVKKMNSQDSLWNGENQKSKSFKMDKTKSLNILMSTFNLSVCQLNWVNECCRCFCGLTENFVTGWNVYNRGMEGSSISISIAFGSNTIMVAAAMVVMVALNSTQTKPFYLFQNNGV